MSRDGRPRRRAPGPDAAIDALYAVVNADALALWPESPLLRGALGVVEQRRLLLIGEPRGGTTALAVRLLFGGASIEGDAFALLGADGLVALPRRFVLRTGARELLPEVAGRLDAADRRRLLVDRRGHAPRRRCRLLADAARRPRRGDRRAALGAVRTPGPSGAQVSSPSRRARTPSNSSIARS